MVSQCSSRNLRSLKAAVALSNTSVTLMERHCYHDAMVTLRDSLFLARNSFPERQLHRPFKEDAIDFALRGASDCLSRSFSLKAREERKVVNLKVLSDSQNCVAELQQTLDRDTMYIIRIDDCRYDNDGPLMHFEAAVILLNYATACRCLNSTRTMPLIETNLPVEAFNYLHMSFRILSRELYSALADSSESDITQVSSLALLVLNNLTQLCIELRMPVPYKKFLDKSRHLNEVFARLKAVSLWRAENLAPAA